MDEPIEITAHTIETLLDEGLLLDVAEYLSHHHPAESAELLESLAPEQIHDIFHLLDRCVAPDIFCYLPDSLQTDIAALMTDDELTSMLERLPPDERADLGRSIPEERLFAILPNLAKKERDEFKALAKYEDGTAGAVMTTDYIAFPQSLTVQQAIGRIRLEGAQKKAISLIFVLDTGRHLAGYLSLEDMILAKPLETLSDVMKPPVAVITADADQEEAARVISKYGLIVLPVVDKGGAIQGIVTHDDAMSVVEEEQTEDMERFMAISGEHADTSYLQTSAAGQFRRRVPWLIVLALFDFVSGAVLHTFQDTIATLMLLTFYMPMLTDMGGNTGSQSATVIVRALALGEIDARDTLRVLWKELRIALLLALCLAAIAFGRVIFTTTGADLPATMSLFTVGGVIALALAAQVVSATLIGALLPLVSSAFRLDPALIASPALTTIVDITGLIIYFGMTKTLLHL